MNMNLSVIPLIGGVFFFAISALMLTVQIPKGKEYQFYKRARLALGGAFALFCCVGVFRYIVALKTDFEYELLCIRTFTALIFTYLNYLAFFYLIEAPHNKRRSFNLIAIMCAVFIVVFSVCGDILPDTQVYMSNIIGFIYLATSIWMMTVCQIKYNKIIKEIKLYYDEVPPIKWMKWSIYMTFILSTLTLLSRYMMNEFMVFNLFINIGFYTYLSTKILNFSPIAIDRIRHDVAEKDSPTIIEKEIEAEATLQKEYYDSIATLLEKWIQEKKYTRDGLTIKDVASELGTNHSYLSAYLNKRVGYNFQVWLNTLRVEESKRLMTANPKISIEEIGQMSGFNYSYNFSRWFRQVTGETPFRWRKFHS